MFTSQQCILWFIFALTCLPIFSQGFIVNHNILFIPIQSAGVVDFSSSVLSQSIRQMTACSQEILTLIR